MVVILGVNELFDIRTITQKESLPDLKAKLIILYLRFPIKLLNSTMEI